MKMLANRPGLRSLLYVAFAVYVILLVKLLLFKVNIGSVHYHYLETTSDLSIRENFALANFIPFKGIYNVLVSSDKVPFKIQNILGNVLVFVPLGIGLPLLFAGRWNVRRIALVGLLTSLGFELIQLFAIRGCFDVDDLLLNTIGTMVGFYILSICKATFLRPSQLQLTDKH